MSPKFYGFLWVLFFLSAGMLLLTGASSLSAIVVFGFVAFGLVFIGMMCVLPSVVSHPPTRLDNTKSATMPSHPSVPKPEKVRVRQVQFPVGLRFH